MTVLNTMQARSSSPYRDERAYRTPGNGVLKMDLFLTHGQAFDRYGGLNLSNARSIGGTVVHPDHFHGDGVTNYLDWINLPANKFPNSPGRTWTLEVQLSRLPTPAGFATICGTGGFVPGQYGWFLYVGVGGSLNFFSSVDGINLDAAMTAIVGIQPGPSNIVVWRSPRINQTAMYLNGRFVAVGAAANAAIFDQGNFGLMAAVGGALALNGDVTRIRMWAHGDQHMGSNPYRLRDSWTGNT